VLHQISGPNRGAALSTAGASSASHKASRNLGELESEFSAASVRQNEGEAANYGIYYDDSKYDYMQHLRELGTASGNSYFVDAAPNKGKGKGKTMKLEDALRDVSINDSRNEFGGAAASVYGSEYSPSTASSFVRKPTYQDQQNVPDAIAGFQPNMDPRLREALEALDDEAFVDDGDDQDIFGELTRNAEEVDAGEFEDTLYDQEDDDGWESDVTEKAFPQSTDAKSAVQTDREEHGAQEHDPSEMPDHDRPVPDLAPENADWMREFSKFKKDAKASNTPAAKPEVDGATERHTTASTMFTVGGTPIRKKKRKGAMTNPSAYSMTSSSLARTEGLRLLDDRFEKVEALYALDEEGEYDDASFADGASMVSGMTGITGMTGMSAASSQAPSLVSRGDYGDVPLRGDFNNVMDDFLSGWQDRSKQTKHKGAKAKRGKNGNEALGIAMLDEVRQGLGPARLSARGKV
jgi:protein LTV1